MTRKLATLVGIVAALAGVPSMPWGGQLPRGASGTPRTDPTKIKNRARDKRQKQARRANRRKA